VGQQATGGYNSNPPKSRVSRNINCRGEKEADDAVRFQEVTVGLVRATEHASTIRKGLVESGTMYGLLLVKMLRKTTLSAC
jgi:hypothetical protein